MSVVPIVRRDLAADPDDYVRPLFDTDEDTRSEHHPT